MTDAKLEARIREFDNALGHPLLESKPVQARVAEPALQVPRTYG